jgi:hypothetical protein
MPGPLSFPLMLLAVIILLLSSAAFLVNYLIFQYPGNFYFPEHMFSLCLIMVLIYLGLTLTFKPEAKIRRRGSEFLYFFCVMSLIALATEAVQFTPFPTIDKHLLAIERFFHIDANYILHWTSAHPLFKELLAHVYDGLVLQMSFIPVILIICGRLVVVREYYFLLLLTTILGFGFYYFFPTTAPASVIDSRLFNVSQLATGLKFHQIHNHVSPTTIDGGLIALPSFHVIWALLCVYMLKEWPLACFLLVLNNVLLIASCVLLGWHFFVDIIGGFIVVTLSLLVLRLACVPITYPR